VSRKRPEEASAPRWQRLLRPSAGNDGGEAKNGIGEALRGQLGEPPKEKSGYQHGQRRLNDRQETPMAVRL